MLLVGRGPQRAYDQRPESLLTIEETVRFTARLRLPGDLSAAELQRVVLEAIARVELADHAGKRVGEISGGQCKRVGIASELVRDPMVMLLDEPTSGLDPDADKQAHMLRGLASGSRAVLLVTHSMRWLHLCDRLVIMGTAVGLDDRAVGDRGFNRFYGHDFFVVHVGTTLLILAALGGVFALTTCLVLQRRQ